MRHTEHAHKRCAQRNLDAEALELVRRYGRRLHRTGAVFYFLGRRDLPEELLRDDRYARLEGTTLLFSLEGELITAYRNREALRQIRKKEKRRLGPSKGWRNVLDYVRPAA
jgi:hypothetical protein